MKEKKLGKDPADDFLESCPFCGYRAKYFNSDKNLYLVATDESNPLLYDPSWYVQCLNCGSRTIEGRKAIVTGIWNSRYHKGKGEWKKND